MKKVMNISIQMRNQISWNNERNQTSRDIEIDVRYEFHMKKIHHIITKMKN